MLPLGRSRLAQPPGRITLEADLDRPVADDPRTAPAALAPNEDLL
jgi:hypothetical protein